MLYGVAMSMIKYIQKNFTEASLGVIDRANQILEEYEEQGFDLTLRQLYYQFVARDLISNNQREYKKLGSIINDARLAGLVDWAHIVDRTRNVRSLSHWQSPSEIIESCASQFRYDLWADQKNRIEVWVEKDALIGIIERVCKELDVPYFSCRGYVSQSEIHDAATKRLIPYELNSQDTHIIHLGDHDPSGVDMSRDISDRLELFGSHASVHRIALNMSQVDKYGPPPNPTKFTDSRASGYVEQYGEDSWELDALEPRVIDALIRDKITSLTNFKTMEKAIRRQSNARKELQKVSSHWDDVTRYVADL